MKKLLAMFLLLFLLVGCNSELLYSEVELEDLNGSIKDFFEAVESQNGTHLYFDGDNVVYVYLNGSNVLEGNKAIYFEEFRVDSEASTLNIHIEQDEEDIFSGNKLKHELIYKITTDKKYETIKNFINGEEAAFGYVSGNKK